MRLVEDLESKPKSTGNIVCGFLSIDEEKIVVPNDRVLGGISRLEEVLYQYDIEEVIVAIEHSQIILNGRIVNDSMGKFVADAAIKNMIAVGQAPKKSKVVILGLTFKENCPDTRNSKVDDIIKRLAEYEIAPIVVDPWASERDAMHEYGVTLTELADVKDADCVIVAVAHNEFKALSLDDIKKLFKSGDDAEKVLIDVKGLYPITALKASGMKYWRL